MVRWRRDETDAWCRVTGGGDPGIDLVPRQLPAFSGLGTLGDLDLDVIGIDEVVTCHAKAPRRNLLDGAASQVSVGVWGEAPHVLAALARI